MLKNLLVTIFLIVPLASTAQKEAYNWYFGENAAISFETSPPQFISGSNMSAFEGCASISDGEGNLLFYTDGIDVWDRTHTIMPNGTGLFGDMSSSQSAVIVKAVNSDNRYYIFTASAYSDPGADNGINYSVVDMSMNSGKGDVVTKNVQLEANTTEKITVVVHSNGVDYWVITSKLKESEYLAFKVTEAGISSTPVRSAVGTLGKSTNPTNSLGYIKPSPDGKYLAACFWGKGVEYVEFNNTTGEVTNPIEIVTGTMYYYGIEFSPNGKYLYITYADITSPPIIGRLWQYDISSGDEVTIQNSKYQISTAEYQYGALQIGPDNNIYCADIHQNHISVINEPNMPQADCDYIHKAISLTSQESYMGLPAVYTFNAINYINICLGDTTKFTLSITKLIDSLRWNFDDIASGQNNTSTETNPSHLFTTAGNFTVTLVTYSSGISDTLTKEVTIQNKPNFSLGVDTALCAGSDIEIGADVGNFNYQWSDGDTNRLRQVNSSGVYYLTVSNGACAGTDSIDVSFEQIPDFSLPDTSICKGERVRFNLSNTWNSAKWNDSSQQMIREVVDSGKYVITVGFLNCSTIDSFTISYKECRRPDIYPSAFTPNADGLNDIFAPVEGAYMRVFTRWGEQLYEGYDGWNGVYKGVLVPDGVYLYIIYSDEGHTIRHKGTVQVLK